ncbi:hypothetical protein LSTR_LSTR007274 [Laodelphax striatellus]|uniref:Uncharacterized protein n=1 Tax=Laodelphax striatellus TaxID=195883 RepID=A0A482XE89_LAOST|nr:hypothetical protein LSTR_LSTR007274 [Laodelphax striatellus]
MNRICNIGRCEFRGEEIRYGKREIICEKGKFRFAGPAEWDKHQLPQQTSLQKGDNAKCLLLCCALDAHARDFAGHGVMTHYNKHLPLWSHSGGCRISQAQLLFHSFISSQICHSFATRSSAMTLGKASFGVQKPQKKITG